MKKLFILLVTLLCLFSIKPKEIKAETYSAPQFVPVFKLKINLFEANTLDVAEKIRAELDEIKHAKEEEALALAEEYVGRFGDCYKTSMAFIKELKEIKNARKEKIDVSEAIPGDLIYYSDNGAGSTHYAVYLSENTALQPGWYGNKIQQNTAIIGKVYYSGFSDPVFYRISEISGKEG